MIHLEQASLASEPVDEIPLMGPAEIGIRLGGLSPQRIYQITQQPNFPKPVARLIMGSVWHRDDVERYIREHRPQDTDEVDDSPRKP